MGLAAADAAAAGRAHRDRRGEFAGGSGSGCAQLAHDLVVARVDVVRELISATGRRPLTAMPIAAAMMPPSEIGVSITRLSPYFALQAVGDAENAAEKARCPRRARRRTGRWPSLMSMAEFRAWIMFIWAMALLARHFVAHFALPAAAGARAFRLKTSWNMSPGSSRRRLGQRAVAHGLLPRTRDVRLELASMSARARSSDHSPRPIR